MNKSVQFHIIVESPPPNVVFGLQKGKGAGYETIQKQTFITEDLHFHLTAEVKADVDELPDFFGNSIHGVRNGRFIYLNIGASAGQPHTCWDRRLKIPLTGITWAILNKIPTDDTIILQTRVNGRGKDGSPNCGTVKPFAGWTIGTAVL